MAHIKDVCRTGFLGLAVVFALGLMMAQSAIAQTARFTTIQVNGNQRIPDSTVIANLGFAPGEEVTAEQVNSGLQALIATGAFETAEITPRGNTLVVDVVEWPTISRIVIEGNTRVEDEELLGFLNSQPRQAYSPERAEEDARIIADVYQQQGRLNATVQPKIIRRADNRVDLVYEVVEGAVVEIERISFVGNTKFSDSRLRRVLASKQAGILRTFVGSDTFIADRIAFDTQLLTDFYNSRGYADFTVLNVSSEFSRERNATFITFSVREGQKFQFGALTVSSLLPEVNAEDFTRTLNIRPGGTFSPQAIQQNVDRMERRAIDKQLDFVQVNPVLRRNDRDLTIDVEFQLVRAPRVFVERIDIEGNATTLDRVIRQQFDVVEGDPFNPKQIERSANRIRALGFFESAEVNTRPGSAADQVIVDVDVVEQPTGSLSLGGSFSLDNGIGVAFGFSERNFLGRGQTLGVDVSVGTQNTDSGISFVEPYFLGRDLRFDAEIFYRETSFNNTNFDTREIGFETGLTFPVTDNSRLRVNYILSQDDIFNVSADSSPILQREEGARTTSAVGYAFSYDTRRTGLDPNAGVLFSFGQRFAGLGGDNKYIRTFTRLEGNRRVFNEEANLRAFFEGGAINFLEGSSRIIDRFSTSSNSLRGFASRGVGPRDLGAVNQDVLGGNYYAVASVEARFPLGLPEEYGLDGGVFYNAGSVWGLDDTDGVNGPGSVDDSFSLRSAIGLALFWQTPIGPVRFDFSQPIDFEEFDERQYFNFSFETAF